MTLLLVSSVNLSEAVTARDGGADIIDVKNPEEGSLGANFPWIITRIRRSIPTSFPLSATIGDFPDLPGSAALAAFGALKAGANIIKVGLKGPKRKTKAVSLIKKVVKAVGSTSDSVKVVACGYADHKRAKTIDPLIIPEVANEAGADIAMLDTAVKDGKSIVDFISIDKLDNFIIKAHSFNIQAALAGSLGSEEISKLKPIGPDVIGVRGSVCVGEDRRRKGISEKAVRKMKSLAEA